jgi:hypothetical protein
VHLLLHLDLCRLLRGYSEHGLKWLALLLSESLDVLLHRLDWARLSHCGSPHKQDWRFNARKISRCSESRKVPCVDSGASWCVRLAYIVTESSWNRNKRLKSPSAWWVAPISALN